MVVDEVRRVAHLSSLDFVGFLEALGRICELKTLPNETTLKKNGCDSIYAYCEGRGRVSKPEDPDDLQSKQPLEKLVRRVL